MYPGSLTNENISAIFEGAGDFNRREITCSGHTLYAYSIDGLVSGGDISEYVFRPIMDSLQADTVKQLYEQMPTPKVVVAVGVCACTGGVFKECYNIIGGADTTIPVDIYVPGCAARPQAIIDGIVKAIDLWQQKADKMEQQQKEEK
jgi:Ni,Fe-hydrogenase I small subunit